MSEGLGFGRKKLIENIVSTNWKIKDPRDMKYSYNELLYIIQEMLEEEGKAYFDKKSINRGHHVFREFVKYLLYRNLANYDSMVLITSEKGCITGNSLLRTKKYPCGIQLNKLVGQGPIEVLSYNYKTKTFEFKMSDGVEYVKDAKICEIRTNLGNKLCGTYDHPVMLENGKYKQMHNFDIYKQEIITTYDDLHRGRPEAIININCSDKIEKVYDVVNVQDNHNFVINNLVVSNTGKSSAGIMMCRQWCKLIGIRFNPARHIAYNNADVMRKIDMLNKFEPILCLPGNAIVSIRKDKKEQKKFIRDMVGLCNYEIKSYNIKNDKFEWCKFDGAVPNGKDVIDTIELENGLKIQATPEHKFLTKNRSFVKMKNLTEDDELVLETKECKNCGKQFFNKQFNAKYCSEKCMYEDRKIKDCAAKLIDPEKYIQRKIRYAQNRKNKK